MKEKDFDFLDSKIEGIHKLHNYPAMLVPNLVEKIIKEYAEKINGLWKGYFSAKGVNVSFGEKMEKDADERELLDIAITKSTLLYTLATDIKYEELTEVEEFEISKKVPFIKKLLDLKMRNFGSELVKEIFGDNVKLDLTEEGMVIVPETGENEIPN